MTSYRQLNELLTSYVQNVWKLLFFNATFWVKPPHISGFNIPISSNTLRQILSFACIAFRQQSSRPALRRPERRLSYCCHWSLLSRFTEHAVFTTLSVARNVHSSRAPYIYQPARRLSSNGRQWVTKTPFIILRVPRTTCDVSFTRVTVTVLFIHRRQVNSTRARHSFVDVRSPSFWLSVTLIDAT